MKQRFCTTTTSLYSYPKLQIAWKEDEDGHGWTGEAMFWTSDNEHEEFIHEVKIRNGAPLESLYVMANPFAAGCWAMGSFGGTDITRRDLQWATIWADQALKDHPERQKNKEKRL